MKKLFNKIFRNRKEAKSLDIPRKFDSDSELRIWCVTMASRSPNQGQYSLHLEYYHFIKQSDNN